MKQDWDIVEVGDGYMRVHYTLCLHSFELFHKKEPCLSKTINWLTGLITEFR